MLKNEYILGRTYALLALVPYQPVRGTNLQSILFNNIAQVRVQPRPHPDSSCTSAYGGTPTKLYGGTHSLSLLIISLNKEYSLGRTQTLLCTSAYGGTSTKVYGGHSHLHPILFNNIAKEWVHARSHLAPSCTRAYGGTPTKLYGGHSHLQPILFNNIAQGRVHPRSHLGPSCTTAYGGIPTKLYGALTYSVSFLIISLKNEYILGRT